MTLFIVASGPQISRQFLVGSLPGLTANLGIALLTTLTFAWMNNRPILILLCMYVGAIYGGSRSAILLNIRETPANAATALDAFPAGAIWQSRKGHGPLPPPVRLPAENDRMLALALVAPVLGDFALVLSAPTRFFCWHVRRC